MVAWFMGYFKNLSPANSECLLYCLLGYDIGQSIRHLAAFKRNLLPPFIYPDVQGGRFLQSVILLLEFINGTLVFNLSRPPSWTCRQELTELELPNLSNPRSCEMIVTFVKIQ
jgi:hypothetical protein